MKSKSFNVAVTGSGYFTFPMATEIILEPGKEIYICQDSSTIYLIKIIWDWFYYLILQWYIFLGEYFGFSGSQIAFR